MCRSGGFYSLQAFRALIEYESDRKQYRLMKNHITEPRFDALQLSKQTSAWFVLFMGFVLTFLIAFIERQHTIGEAKDRFSFAADDVVLRVQERMDAFALMLRGASGLFSAQSMVTRGEWAAYVDNLRLNENLSAVQGVGFSQLIPRDQLKNHTDSVVSEGFDDYTISPRGERDLYT